MAEEDIDRFVEWEKLSQEEKKSFLAKNGERDCIKMLRQIIESGERFSDTARIRIAIKALLESYDQKSRS